VKHCAQCKLDLPDTSQFCRQCGGTLAESAPVRDSSPRCSECNAVVQPNWLSCAQCGNLLHSGATTVKMAVPISCLNCNATLQPGMRFCVACGTPAAVAQDTPLARTVIEDRADPSLSKTLIEVPRDTDPTKGVRATPILYQPGDFPCRTCGALIRAGHTFCEACGATVTSQGQTSSVSRNRKTIIIAASVAGGLLVLLLGWFFLGVNVTVKATPSDAQVILDDKIAGGDGTTFTHVLRGKHTLRVKRDGFEESVMTVNLGVFDFSRTLNVQLAPLRYALMLTATPNACRVLLD